MNNTDHNPYAQLQMAVSTQPGPDGKELVSIHIGSMIMNCVFVIPLDGVDQFIHQMSNEIKLAASRAKRKNSGLTVVGAE